MKPDLKSAALWAVLGVVAPGALIHVLAGANRRELGLTAAPFGRPAVLAIHLLAAAPLAMLAATRLPTRRTPGLAWLALGAASALGAACLAPWLASRLDSASAGFWYRMLVRTVIVLAAEFPWMALAVRAIDARPVPSGGLAEAAVATLVAFLPPTAYADQMLKIQAVELGSYLDSGRLRRAQGVLEGLWDLGYDREVQGMPVAQARVRFARDLGRLRRRAGTPLAPDAAPSARLARAAMLIPLDRLDEAAALLGPIAAADLEAALVLGSVERDRGRFGDAARSYREALHRLGGRRASDRDARDLAVTAIDGLAESLRLDGRPEEAEREYLAAIAAIPYREAYFHEQLGRLYLDGGRPASALAQLREATRLDPASAARVEPMLRSLRVRTPACLLRF